MARLGRLGCTITRQFVWGLEVTNIRKTFRGTVTTPKNNGIVIRVNGDETRWSGTMKGAVRRLRRLANETHQRQVTVKIASGSTQDDLRAPYFQLDPWSQYRNPGSASRVKI